MDAEQRELRRWVAAKTMDTMDTNIHRGLEPYHAAELAMNETREWFASAVESAFMFACDLLADEAQILTS